MSRPTLGISIAVTLLAAVALMPAGVAAEPAGSGRSGEAVATLRRGSGMRLVGVLRARDCVEVAGIVSLPRSKVGKVLPPGYSAASFLLTSLQISTGLQVGDAPLEASLLMGVETCRGGRLNGRSLHGAFSFGERVVEVRPQDDTPGYHFYAIEQVTDRRRLARALNTAGMPARFVPGVSGRANLATGESRGGDVDIVTVSPAPVDSPLSTVTIWRETPRGTTLLRLGVRKPASTGGLAVVRADEGSRMAELMGSTTMTGVGAVNRFDFVARVYR